MKDAITKTNELVVSSLDISELTGKQHKNVLADVRKMLDQIKQNAICGEYTDAKGRAQPVILLTSDEAKMILSKYGRFDIAWQLFQGVSLEEIKPFFVRNEFSFGEDVIENLFSGYLVIPQFPVFGGKYKIDWYIPELKLAIEYDEEHHRFNKEEDEARQKEIEKELGCKFLRYTENNQ